MCYIYIAFISEVSFPFMYSILLEVIDISGDQDI